MTYDIRETPEEFFGGEPTLLTLIEHTTLNGYLYSDIDTIVLDRYFKSYKSYGKFYLGGQLEYQDTMKITKKNMDAVKKINREREGEQHYGGHCNFLEYVSIIQANKDFENLQKIIERFYEYCIHDLYRPPDSSINGDSGGILYQKIEENTRVGK